jgi:S1-C subfamily serine protease
LIAYVIREKKPGELVKLDLLRDGKTITVSLKLP